MVSRGVNRADWVVSANALVAVSTETRGKFPQSTHAQGTISDCPTSSKVLPRTGVFLEWFEVFQAVMFINARNQGGF